MREQGEGATPVYPHALLGFREWKITDGELGARWRTAERSEWSSRLAAAACDRLVGERHPAPDRDCGCGLNAYHSLESLFATWHMRGSSRHRLAQTELICGAICGAGRVEIHHEGWRAEVAQILFLINTHPDQLARDRALAARYGVELTHHTQAEARAESLRAVCAPAPKSLIPPPPEQSEYERARVEVLRQWRSVGR